MYSLPSFCALAILSGVMFLGVPNAVGQFSYKISQDSITDPNKRILTDVFVVNTCDPYEVSLRKRFDDDSIMYDNIKTRRNLEIRPGAATSFVIEGVNPLRYKYYINSEEVTQFLDDNKQTYQLSKFIREGYFVSFEEIKVPEIFKEEIGKSNTRSTLDFVETKLKEGKDSLTLTLFEYLNRRYSQQFDYETDKNGNAKDPEIRKLVKAERKQLEEIEIKLSRQEYKLTSVIDEYEQKIMTLPISGNGISLLTEYKNMDTTNFSRLPKISAIQQSIKEFGVKYGQLNLDFKKVDSFLLAYNSVAYPDLLDSINNIIRDYGYTVALQSVDLDYLRSYDLNSKLTSILVKEFMLKKRYQILEEFSFGTATKIGIMLQSSFREISELTNAISLQNCINDELVNSVRIKRSELIELFDFVQGTSAELQILVSYFDVSNNIYKDLASSINGNYRLLLNYLKDLNIIEPNNIVEFTLPSSANLRNIDFVRYRIDREDKVTGSKQVYEYDFWIRGGLKVDFSVGIFATGLTDNTYQKHPYEVNGVLTDSVQINRQNTGGYNIGFGGVVNVSPRTGSSWVKPGINFGAIFSANQKLQLITGLALHFGKFERLILHGGIAAGFVSTIDLSQHQMREVDKNDIYLVKANYSEFTIPLLEKFSLRPVFGLSYNLSKKNALQAITDNYISK